MHRPDWDRTWMSVAEDISQRSKCVRRQIGAVIVSPENFHTWLGYNGPPAKWEQQTVGPTCESWCERSRLSNLGRTMATYDNCITIHAEENALLKSDPVLRKNGTIYVTSFPCWVCAKSVANSGLRRVVTKYDVVADAHRLPDNTEQMLASSGLEVVIYAKQ